MFIDDTKIFYLENFLTQDEMGFIDNVIEANSAKIAEMMEKFKDLEDKRSGPYNRDITLQDIGDNIDVYANIHDRVKRLILDKFNNGVNDFRLNPIHNMHAIYPPLFLEEHYDAQYADIVYGVVIYLTDPKAYVGGDIVYTKLNKRIRPSKGSIIIHPGGPDYIHAVDDVLSGVRLNISMFAHPNESK